MTTPAEVAEHLYMRFSTEEWRLSHTNHKVNEIVVLYSDATDISERAEVERSKYDSLVGQKKSFSYMPLEKGVVAQRCLSCFCPACLGARGRGLGTQDSNLTVVGCDCSGEHFKWNEHEVPPPVESPTPPRASRALTAPPQSPSGLSPPSQVLCARLGSCQPPPIHY